MFKLVIQDDEGKTTVVPLIRDEITIGRKEGNTIRLTERNVSRRHARILRNNGEVHIEDLGSYNGIRVNNARIAERVSLRVSDQVQIGDYKLYLKAEGTEQGDESRTSQHERHDSQVPTEAMAAISPAITAPQPVQPAPSPQLVGNPNRTQVDLSGTDPSGRPVVPVASVTALTDAVGYGKLVVLSSNFAGKELELSRPQMIVGRTDENDIVINHRSISRNHAKLVREPDTGRYTISDLQSSNGVRVNGQDYGKVELRRGDVVDLGHVRLRFVEPGEDFVFSRDAVITDVPEAGGKRGVVLAILAAILVLGAGVFIYTTMMRGDRSSDPVVGPGPGTNSALVPDAGDTAVAVLAPDQADTAPDAANPTGSASGASPAVAIKPTGKPEDDNPQKARCAELNAKQDWQGLIDCAKALAPKDKDKAKEYSDTAVRETRNELAAKEVQKLLSQRNLRDAQTALNKIDSDSVYYFSMRDLFTKAENAAIEREVRKAQLAANAHDCASLRTQYRQLTSSSTQRVAAAVGAVKCTDKAVAEPAAVARVPVPAGSASGSGSATASAPTAAVAATGPCASVNVDELMEQASHQYSSGYPKLALGLAQKALACKQTPQMYRFAATYSCGARDIAAAKLYFGKVPTQFQTAIVQRCQLENLDVRSPSP